MGYKKKSHFMIVVLNLKLRFVTDVLTERSGSLSEPGSIFFSFFFFFLSFFHSNLKGLMEFVYFTGYKRPVPRNRD